MRRAAGSVAVCMLCVCFVVVAGCNRKPRFVPPGGDSTGAYAFDSTTVLAQDVSDLWDRATDRRSVSEASSATVRLARQFLLVRGGPVLSDGLAAYLDSIGVGVEVAADRRDSNTAAANFFARTSPEAGSEPWILWRDGSDVRYQAVEGRGLRLFQMASRSYPANEVALLFGRPASGGFNPLLLVLRRTSRGGWQIAQSVGTDSLGGTGRVEFGRQDSTIIARARTYRSAPRFEECASCPHLYRQRVLEWDRDGFHIASDRLEPSQYQAFVEFIDAVSLGDSRLASSFTTNPGVLRDALRFGWDHSVGPWRVAPGLDSGGDTIIFYRGSKEAYRVSFELNDGNWFVAAIEPTTRAIE